ncbi:hypothetical protein [Flavicella sediminum]|uniref:hypothetical protein n=1 Tax=Flavicella sediminum TaxID=2585141 RepID=UPI001123B14F|nr:hypothetical protein [Flavicella sediminum]
MKNVVWSLYNEKPLWLLFLIGVFVRLFLFLFLGFTAAHYNDSENYIALAERLLQLDLAGYQFERTPGYSILLILSGINFSIVILLQSLLGIASMLLSYVLFMSRLEKKTAFLISLSLSFIANYIFYERAILTETLTLFLLLLIVYLYAKSFIKYKYTIGFLCAFLMLTRTHFLFLAPLIFSLVAISGFKKGMRFHVFNFIPVVLPSLLCFVVWSGMNKYENGKFALTPYMGINLAQSTVRFFDKYEGEQQLIKEIYVSQINQTKLEDPNKIKNAIWFAYEELLQETGLTLLELSNVLGDMSKQLISENVDLYLYQVCISFKDFWLNDLYWMRDDLGKAERFVFNNWRRTARVLQQALNGIFILATVYYVFLFLFKNSQSDKVISLIVIMVMFAAISQAFIIYGDNSRFCFPFYPLIAFVSVYFIQDLVKKNSTI